MKACSTLYHRWSNWSSPADFSIIVLYSGYCCSSEDFVQDSMGCDILDLQMEKRNLSMYHAIEEFIQAQNNPTPISNSYSKQQQNCSIASSFLTFRFPFPELCHEELCHRFGVQCTIIKLTNSWVLYCMSYFVWRSFLGTTIRSSDIIFSRFGLIRTEIIDEVTVGIVRTQLS